MARSHGILKTSVWDVGSEFRTLTLPAQWAYVMLLSQPQINNCGVVPYVPEKWARLAAGATRDQLDQALAELRDRRFILIDEDTGELLVRTFIKHDRIWKQPNLVKRARKELLEVESDLLRDYLAERHPWLTDDLSMDEIEAHETPGTSQIGTPSGTPSERGSETPSGTPPRPRARTRTAPSPAPRAGEEGAQAAGARSTPPQQAASSPGRKPPENGETAAVAPTYERARRYVETIGLEIPAGWSIEDELAQRFPDLADDERVELLDLHADLTREPEAAT
jgi:hypothetical protein